MYMNIQDLLNKLPGNWHELKLSQYQTLTDTLISESEDFAGVENTIRVISKLTDESIDDLESLPMKDISTLAKKLEWMLNPPTKVKTNIKWKDVEEITYNEFITFLQIQNEPLKNLHIIFKVFAKNKMSDDQILDMPTDEAVHAFFLFRMKLKKFYQHSIRETKKKLKKQMQVPVGKMIKELSEQQSKKPLDGIS